MEEGVPDGLVHRGFAPNQARKKTGGNAPPVRYYAIFFC